MQLNYAAGKSECLVALRGKGATAVRERVFVSQTGTLLLRVVDAYKHLCMRCSTASVTQCAYRRSDGDNATDREVLVAAGCCTIDVQVAMLRLWFFGRLVRWLFYRLEMGMSAHGQRQFVGIWHGSANPNRVVISIISLILKLLNDFSIWLSKQFVNPILSSRYVSRKSLEEVEETHILCRV